jgi:AhpD family alkylhydroperoxidase
MHVNPSPSVVSAAFRTVENFPVFAESAAAVARGGLPVEMLQAMCLRPELLQGFAHLSAAVYPGGQVERSIKELIILTVSRANRCQFCTDSHLEIVQSMGMSQEAGTPRELAAVDYTRAAIADSNAIPHEVFQKLRAVFSEPEIVEVTAMIGLISMLNMFNNCLAIRYRGDYSGVAASSPTP